MPAANTELHGAGARFPQRGAGRRMRTLLVLSVGTWRAVVEEEERAKREELERILEENNRKIAEAQAKLAEEQLKIVEEQRKIHEERMKLEQERQRQQKEEQKIILGKGKSRPKLSFSLKSPD